MRAPVPPPPQAREGLGGGGGPQGARRVTLKPREPGVSTFAQRRVQPGRTINEAGVLGVLWEAIHHGRTLYGRPCKDLRSFFDACDTEGHEAIVNDRLSDAMLRLGVGLTPQQVETLISTIDVDVTGTVDYDELENWMKGRDEQVAAKYRGNKGAAADLAERAPWGGKKGGAKGGTKSAQTPRLPAVSSARGDMPPLDEERHEYLRRDMSAMVPLHNPSLYVEPKASQLEAAIMMHERGYQERRSVYSEERAAARAAENKKDRAYRRQLKEKNQQRLIESERQRKEEIAAKFGLKMAEIEPTEWAEVEAEIEAQVERRERRKKRKEDLSYDPAGVRRKRERAKAKRVGAAVKIQAWLRGTYTRRFVVKQLQSEKGERERKEALRQRKRLEVCDAVLEKLVTDLERLESMEKVALMDQLFKLQNQKAQLEEQFDAVLDPTETAAAKAKAKRLAEEAKFAQRWARLQKKREDEQRRKEEARARAIELAKTNLPAIFGTPGDEDASPPIPPVEAAKWAELGRGNQAAATRLGFNAQCWPELEENAVAAVEALNGQLAWDEWHADTWKHIQNTLLLGSVAGILGLTGLNWTKLKRCKPIPKRVYRIGTPPPAPAPIVIDEPEKESETVRLHKLALFFSGKHEASLTAALHGQTPASLELFYGRLCTALRPFIRTGMPESLARMLRDGLMQVGWAGGETSEPLAEPEPEPEPEDESTAREKALAKELEDMKAMAKAALAASRPEPEPEVEPEPEPDASDADADADADAEEEADTDADTDTEEANAEADTDKTESNVHLIQLRAEETLNQLHQISGAAGNGQVIPTKAFGLQPGNHMSDFLRHCVKEVHALRADYHSVSHVTNAAVAATEKTSATNVVASLIHAALSSMSTKDVDSDAGTLTRVSHRLVDAFRFFDRNGDGKISPKELQLALRSLNAGGDSHIGADLSMKEIEKFMKEGDTDGDGSIDYGEFVAHFHFHDAEIARKSEEKIEAERRKTEQAAQAAAAKLAAAQQARLDKVTREAQDRMEAEEAQRALNFEARRVLPAAFNGPFDQLGLAKEAAARRLGFTPEMWPRVLSTMPSVVAWENLDPGLKRMAIVLGFDEEQHPPTWGLIQVQGENGKEDVRSLGVVTGVRHAQQEVMLDEERKRREREVVAFRKSVFAEAARIGAENQAAHQDVEETHALQEQQKVLEDFMQKEEAAASIQRAWKSKKEKELADEDDFSDDAPALNEQDQQRLDQVWTWSLAGDKGDLLSRQRLDRYLLDTSGRELTDSLYATMCEKIGFDPDLGMNKSIFVMAFYGPYMEPGQSASVQIATHYEKLELINAQSPHADDTAMDETSPDMFFGISQEREAELRQVFACVDVNGDGSLSRAELIMRLRKDPDLAALLDLPVRVGEAERAAFEAVFRGMDENGDNEIDADEFVQFFARRESGEAPTLAKDSLENALAVPIEQLASDPEDDDTDFVMDTADDSQSDYVMDTADESSMELSAAAPLDEFVLQDSPAATPLPFSDESDSDSDIGIEELRRQRAAQLGGTPPR
jgi:Ca2+-binding EF-hand superfamily protein